MDGRVDRFDGQTVLVSGAARGMGESHARGFLDEGASVVVADVRDDEGTRLAEDLGGRAVFAHLDVTRAEDWDRVVREAERRFGPVSVLVNNAGISAYGLIEETGPDVWRRVIDINLTGQFLGIRAATPSLRRAGGGVIVNVASVGGFIGGAGLAAYGASKWASRGLTRSAALELGRDGIRVVSVSPGMVRTAMAGEPGVADIPVDTHAIPRMARPEEITDLVLFLASREAAFITGADYIADGGALAGVAPQAETAGA